MGRKYDAYEKAAQYETAAKKEWRENPTSENEAKARWAEADANEKWDDLMNSPHGD